MASGLSFSTRNRFVGPDGVRAGLDAMHAASTNRSSTHDYHETHLYGDLAFARWTSRYVERAEDIARLINVNMLLQLDLPKKAMGAPWIRPFG